ncbi:MAG: hypothetical protein ACYTGG_10445, partial [Planctomycetota bacterium]
MIFLLGLMPSLLPWLLVLVAAAASTVAACSLARRRARQAPINPRGSFRRIARGLGLTREQRRIARQMARRACLTAPASLLVSQGCFEHAIEVTA